jgi:hypothetical protein
MGPEVTLGDEFLSRAFVKNPIGLQRLLVLGILGMIVELNAFTHK